MSHIGLPLTGVAKQLAAWQSGLGHELGFWERYAAERGGPFAVDFTYRMNPDGGMEHRIGQEITTAPVPGAKILDVGSGPLTKVGKVYNGERPQITATDPLAWFYTDIFARHGIRPLVAVKTAFAEDLSACFPSETFDVTVCINALDHSFNPARALTEMIEVTKMGGAVILHHRLNEAEHENYQGLHQWNFDERGGKFVIWNKEVEIDVASALINCATVTRVESEGGGLRVVIRRTGHPGCAAPGRYRDRVAELLSAFVAVAGASSQGGEHD